MLDRAKKDTMHLLSTEEKRLWLVTLATPSDQYGHLTFHELYTSKTRNLQGLTLSDPCTQIFWQGCAGVYHLSTFALNLR